MSPRLIGLVLLAAATSAQASPVPPSRVSLPVYRGPVVMPRFVGRDRDFAPFRTMIREAMAAGPDFAGRYRIVEIGCGAGCRFVAVGDVATGRMFRFPYGGEENYELVLRYGLRDARVVATWLVGDVCHVGRLRWTGRRFLSEGEGVGASSDCG
jgi:hypothetical protein